MTVAENVPNSIRLDGPTIWTRLLSSSRDPSLQDGHQVAVRDPLWLLGRQLQVGELSGFNGGSPVRADYQIEQAPITAYQPWQGAAEKAAAGWPPLEVQVESEAVTLGLRGSIQLGLRFEAMVWDTLAPAQAETAITEARTQFPIAANPPPGEISDPEAVVLRSALGGKVTNGWELFQSLAAGTAAAATLKSAAGAAVDSFTNFCSSLYVAPVDPAWNPTDLQFEFSVIVEHPGNSVTLPAGDFPGGQLDWFSFDCAPPPATKVNPQQVTRSTGTAIPHHLRFPGMPPTTWWEFEDAQTDLGSLETEVVDLTKMLLTEFTAACANDWFEVSVPVTAGTLDQVTGLVVTDTFGTQTVVPPTATLDPPVETGKAWAMFSLSGPPGSGQPGSLFVLPALGRVQDGDPLEIVLFLRDDMAAMCWAVERRLQGPLDNGRDGYEAQLDLDPPAPPALPAGIDANYLIGTTVPRNWIPLLPFSEAPGKLMFRRGAMLATDPASNNLVSVEPKGVILDPGTMLLVRDQAATRAGVQVDRYFRRARGTDGSVYCWMARRAGPGKGEGSSGLAFDVVATS